MTHDSELIAAFAANLRYEAVPAAVINHHKLLILDTIGCGLFGSTVMSTQIARRVAEKMGDKGKATVWGTSMKLPAANAAFANGVAVESYELDDVGADHTGCAAVSAALAMAEQLGFIDGRTFLTAVIVGFEVKARIYHAGVPNDTRLRRGFHDFGNAFAAATAAGRVLGFDAVHMTHALSMAASQVCGLYHPSMVKRMHPGWHAHAGVVSALLVAEGLTGIPDVLERKWGGFYSAYFETYDRDILVGELGERYISMVHGFKYYAACGSKITVLQALSEMRERFPVITEDVEDIVRVTLHVSEIFRMWSGVATDGVTPMPVVTVEQALMSAEYVVAVMLVLSENDWLGVRGRRLPYTDDWLRDERVRRLISKIDLVVDRTYVDPVRIEIRMRNGKTFSADAPRYRHGHVRDPMNTEEVIQKFRNLASYCVEDGAASRIIDAILHVERATDVASIAAELCPVATDPNVEATTGCPL